MNDLISRQAAIDALHMHLMYRMGTDSNKKRLDEWINNLPSAQPTVDAVPVIRCKDCKHYYALNEVRGNCSEYNFVEKIPIDYCSWAERRTDEA